MKKINVARLPDGLYAGDFHENLNPDDGSLFHPEGASWEYSAREIHGVLCPVIKQDVFDSTKHEPWMACAYMDPSNRVRFFKCKPGKYYRKLITSSFCHEHWLITSRIISLAHPSSYPCLSCRLSLTGNQWEKRPTWSPGFALRVNFGIGQGLKLYGALGSGSVISEVRPVTLLDFDRNKEGSDEAVSE